MRKIFEEKQSFKMFPLNLSDLAPEPPVNIYWCPHPSEVVNEDSFFFIPALEGE